MVDATELAVIFLATVSDGSFERGEALEEAIALRLASGRAAWPGVELEDEAFVRHLAACSPSSELVPIEHAPDLWIACACALGARGSASAFEKAYRATIERATSRANGPAADEATQMVLVSLLVKDGDAPPRIAEYRGRAALRTWLTTVATRTALGLHRRKDAKPHESLTGQAEAIAGEAPELALARARHGPELEQALREAIGALDARQVVLLRLHHAEGWSIDRLAALHRIGRSTAARWVAAAREALLDETKRLLRQRLGLTSSELESLVAALQSQVDVSLVRLLEPKD